MSNTMHTKKWSPLAERPWPSGRPIYPDLRAAIDPLLGSDHACLYDVNQCIDDMLVELIPACCEYGIPLIVRQDRSLPLVPMLVEPISDALCAALEVCFEGAADSLVSMTTSREEDYIAATIECISSGEQPRDIWRDVGFLEQVDLIVGEQAARALGGRLRCFQREEEIQIRLTLPIDNLTAWTTPYDSRVETNVETSWFQFATRNPPS